MKRLILAMAVCLALPLQTLAGVPSLAVKSVDELGSLPDGLGVVEIVEGAQVSALDAEGIASLLRLTPEKAEALWGKAQERHQSGADTVLAFANGYSLNFNAKGQVRRIFYDVPQGRELPYGPEALQQWGFVPAPPDRDGSGGLRWKSEDGTIRDVLLQPVSKDGHKRLGSLQVILKD